MAAGSRRDSRRRRLFPDGDAGSEGRGAAGSGATDGGADGSGAAGSGGAGGGDAGGAAGSWAQGHWWEGWERGGAQQDRWPWDCEDDGTIWTNDREYLYARHGALQKSWTRADEYHEEDHSPSSWPTTKPAEKRAGAVSDERCAALSHCAACGSYVIGAKRSDMATRDCPWCEAQRHGYQRDRSYEAQENRCQRGYDYESRQDRCQRGYEYESWQDRCRRDDGHEVVRDDGHDAAPRRASPRSWGNMWQQHGAPQNRWEKGDRGQ